MKINKHSSTRQIFLLKNYEKLLFLLSRSYTNYLNRTKFQKYFFKNPPTDTITLYCGGTIRTEPILCIPIHLSIYLSINL